MPLIADNKLSLDEQRYARLLNHNAFLRDRLTMETVLHIKNALAESDECYAEQLWRELDLQTTNALLVAPTFGGIFTTRERDFLKTIPREWAGA